MHKMTGQQLLLNWKHHNSCIVAMFEKLLQENQLVDCTLAAEGQYLKAHRVVLSASSSYFEVLFGQESEKNPIVILKDVKFEELKAAVNFMYKGEVEVYEDRLAQFLEVADALQIKGLGSDRKTSRFPADRDTAAKTSSLPPCADQKSKTNPGYSKSDFSPSSLQNMCEEEFIPGESLDIKIEEERSENNSVCTEMGEDLSEHSSGGAINEFSSKQLGLRFEEDVSLSFIKQHSSYTSEDTHMPFEGRPIKSSLSTPAEANFIVKEGPDYPRQKLLKCLYCPYTSAYQTVMKRHAHTHTRERPFKCTLCPFACIQKSNLIYHTRTHTGEKPFKCPHCNFAFKQKSGLKRHMKTHTGEKPFKCSLCFFACTLKASLTRHMRTMHMGEKPFKCSHCSFDCLDKSTLVAHEQTHTAGRPL